MVYKKNKILLEDIKGEGIDSGANKFELKKAKIGSISINGENYLLKSIFVVPSQASLMEAKIGGIFSPQSAFEGQDFILDFPNKKIILGTISADEKGADKINITPCSKKKRNKYLIDVSLEDAVGKFYIDTGGKMAAITTQFAEKLESKKGKTQTRSGVGGYRDVIHLEKINLVVGKISKQIPVDIEAKGVSCPTADGKLGNDFFKNYRVFFNKERSAITLQ